MCNHLIHFDVFEFNTRVLSINAKQVITYKNISNEVTAIFTVVYRLVVAKGRSLKSDNKLY